MAERIEAVLLCAGEGTRMRPLTYTRPKSMLYVGGKPILYHQLKALEKAGVDRAILVVGYKKERIFEYIESIKGQLSIKITFVEQKGRYGTGGALMCAKKEVKHSFFLLAGDLIFDETILKEMKQEYDGSFALAVKEVAKPERYGVVIEEKGIVKTILEKPFNPPSNIINTSIYLFNPEIFDKLKTIKKSERGEYELTDVLEGAKIVKMKGFWKDLAYPWDLFDANQFLLERMAAKPTNIYNSTIKGKVIMEEGAEIFDSFIDVGVHYIGRNVKIGPHSYLRGWNMIGDYCVIGDSTSVKNAILFPNVKAKHLTYIGDSIIGEGVNFGAGSQIANLRFDSKYINVQLENGRWETTNRKKFGCVVGDGTKFGILSGVMPGKLIGNECWIGPGVIVNKNLPPRKKVLKKQQLVM